MHRPPRNLELERLVIDVLRSDDADAAERHAAWEVYADWLLGLGEPVGEWLAASLRADDDGDAAAPIRAQLGDIERACRFRLVDLELADLSEVPELTRIAEFTWERGFITTAAFRCRAFRAFDSELLGHTPDRFVDVVLRSPSACMLHRLDIDVHAFEIVGSRWADLSALLAALPDDLPLRRLDVGDRDARVRLGPRSFAHLPELTQLSLHASELSVVSPLSLAALERLYVRVEPRPGEPRTRWRAATPAGRPPKIDDLRALFEGDGLPRLRELVLAIEGIGEELVGVLAESSLLGRIRSLRLEHVDEGLAAALVRHGPAFAGLERWEVVGVGVPIGARAALREFGCVLV